MAGANALGAPRTRAARRVRMIAMAITQIHAHRRNRHGSWRDGEGGALDAPRPLGSCSERSRRRERSQRRAADATPRLLGVLCVPCRPVDRSAGRQQQRQRQRSQEDATPALSPRQWRACSSSRTHPEATRARRTEHSHPHVASNALRLAMPPEAATSAARSRRHSIDYQARRGSGYKRGPAPRSARAGSSALSACALRLRGELQT